MIRKLRGVSIVLAAVLILELLFNLLPVVPSQVEAAASGPVLLGTYPADDAVNVPVNTNLTMTFDENVTKGTGSASLSIRRVTDNQVIRTVAVTSSEVMISGNVVTISLPTGTLESGVSYYVLVDAGAFQNSNGMNFAGIVSATAWNFSVVSLDTTTPAITAVFPSAGSTMASIDTMLSLEFNKSVFASSGNISIQNTVTGDTQVIGVTTSAVQGSGSGNIRITPTSQLAAGVRYTVSIDSNAFTDSFGKGMSAYNWSFTTTAPPMNMPSLTPANRATGVSVTNMLVMKFDSTMSKGSGNIEIRKVSDNSVFRTISVNSTSVQVSGSTVMIDHPVFEANTGYYVVIDSGAFVSATSSTRFQGISDALVWSFTTVDTKNPTATTFSPLKGGTATALDSKLIMTFDKAVYPKTGHVLIRTVSNDAVFASVSVTSNQITGGGTNTITIDPGRQFVDNTSYYVQIGNQAFEDSSGNAYAGISDKTGWTFRVNRDTSAPYVVTYSPLNNATNVTTRPTLTLTFNKPIQRSDGVISIKRSGTSISYATNATVDSTDNRKLNIIPTSTLVNGVSYYVDIPSGAVVDLAGNKFAGIQNEFQWTFRTGTDTTVPTLSKAEMTGGTKVVLTYSKVMNAAFIPSTSNFFVTVNDVERSISNISINEKTVVLTLSSGVIYGQTVKLSYSKGSTPLQDLSGNQASNISSYTVINSADTTLPKPTSGLVSHDTVMVYFSEPLSAMTAVREAYNQFQVYVGGSLRTIKSVTAGGIAATITLDSIVSDNAPVYVNYTPGAYPLRDYYSNSVQSFSNFYVKNPFDKQPPELQTVEVYSNKLTLTYNEGINTNSLPTAGQFAVLVNQTARTVTNVEVSGTQVILTLSSAVSTNQTVQVSYVIGYPSITDLNGNQAPSFTNQLATHTTGMGLLRGMSIQGQVVTLNFTQTLNSSYVPMASQFYVKINGIVSTVSNVSLSGSNVLLQVARTINTGDTVLVSYTGTSGTLRTTTGITIGTFTDYSATSSNNNSNSNNSNTGTTVTLPTGLDWENTSGIIMKETLASTSLDMTLGNRTASRYTIAASQLQSAYEYILKKSGVTPRVKFVVPSTEQAAIVSIPLGQLESIHKQISNASFAVSYKELTYELNLGSLSYTELASLAGTSTTSAQLIIRLDTAATITASSSLMTAINRSTSQLMTSPAYFQLSVISGSSEQVIYGLSEYVTMSIKSNVSFDPKKTAVVWLDNETGGLSFVPTRIATVNSSSIITFMRPAASGAYAVISGTSSFTDTGKHWAGSDINMMTAKNITAGTSATKYEPEKPVTRAEFAMFIVRGLGLSGDKAEGAKFKDVSTSSAMAAYIGAASKAGIVKGHTDGTFKPNNYVTREEMAAMIIRAAAVAGVQVELKGSAASYFTPYRDRASIANWAQDALAKSVDAGIITGLTKTTMGPKGNATRAQAAIMIKRLLGYIGFMDV